MRRYQHAWRHSPLLTGMLAALALCIHARDASNTLTLNWRLNDLRLLWHMVAQGLQIAISSRGGAWGNP